eukprot:4181141-Pyramimonas_sp.AAC.1
MCIRDSLMYRAEVCAVLHRAELRCAMPRRCSIASWVESSFASEGARQEDAPRNVSRDAPGDMPGDAPWGRRGAGLD